MRMLRSVSRRDFLGAVGAVAALELAGCAKHVGGPNGRLFTPGMTLRSAGEQSGILAGCAVSMTMLREWPEYAVLVGQQAGILVAENAMKFAGLRPSATTFDFHEADYLVEFAEKHGQRVRGHNFVWHRALPGWFEKTVTAENAEQVLVDHITTVAERYAGKMHSWDVVNEAIRVEDSNPGGMRDTPWRKLLGDKYIDIAYRAARRADGKAMLVYNEYGIEADDDASKKKRVATLELLRGMQKRGVPVDALGIQSHITAGSGAGYGAGLAGLIDDVERMGLKVLITEFDVNDKKLPEDVSQRDAGVAAAASQYLEMVLRKKAVVALLTWGITDKGTWLNDKEFGRKDDAPERPLPFDAELRPTAAFFAEYDALRAAGIR